MSGDHLRRKEVKAMYGCCGTTEANKAKTEQEEQKAEAKENAHTASYEPAGGFEGAGRRQVITRRRQPCT